MNHLHTLRLLFLSSLFLIHGMAISDTDTPDSTVIDQLSLGDLFDLKVTIASKVEENISDAPGVISVVTRDEIERFGGTTLSDILKRVPSFLGSSIYMTDRSMISSRGDQLMQSSSHILFLINGRPMREIQEGGIKSEVYESFPLSVIERIEIIRGPGSVLYGTQAFSAVINIITKSPENKTVSLHGNLGEGLRNNIMGDLQYKLGDFGLVVAGRYADKGGWKTTWHAPGNPPGTPYFVNNVDITIPDYGPGIFAEANWKDIRLMFSYNKWTNMDFVTPVEWLNTAGITQYHAANPVHWKKLFGDLGYRYTFTDWYNASLNITYTRSWFESTGIPITTRDSYEALGELTNFFTPFENFNVLLGGVIGYMTGLEKDPELEKNPRPLYNVSPSGELVIVGYQNGIYNKGYVGNSFSGYLQADYHMSLCKMIGGLQVNKIRYKDSLDNVDEFDVDFNPRAGLIFYPFENINVKALYSTAYRAPSLNELYVSSGGIFGKMIERNDPHFVMWDHEYTLKPEKVNTYDLGFNYQDQRVLFGINGFYSLMKNIISQSLDTSRYSVNTYDNLGKVTIFGFECEAKYSITKEFLIQGSFLYQQSKDEITGEYNKAPVPNFSLKGGLSYHSGYGLTLSFFNIFRQSVDPKYFDPVNKNTRHFNMANLYCKYDMNRLFKVALAKELSLVLSIDNLFDEEVWMEIPSLPTAGSVPYNHGRTIYGGFKVSF